jgi:hypothetical protein
MIKFIIYNPKTQLFDFFCNAIIHEFNKRSIETILIKENIIIYDKLDVNFEKDIILILVNPHFINDFSEIKLEIINIKKRFKYKIIYLTEPINFLIEKKVNLELIELIKPYCLWTYTYENFNKIKTFINTYKIFPSYNESYNLCNITFENLKKRNNKNIIFFGNINENRINICNEFNNVLINKTDAWTIKDWEIILNNYLFYLNIHRRNNCKSFESFRIIPILANGGVIFSEHSNIKDEEEYKDYNIIFVQKNNIFSTFKNYIKNINYNIILEKALNYRKNMITNNNIDNFLNFHYTI